MTGQSSETERERRGFGSFLIWLSGANTEILRLAPSERPKYQGMGGAVLTTALLASLAMFFAMQMAVKASFLGALVVSLVWFWAILNLDRWLVTSLQRSSSRWDLVKVAVPRLVLALLLGLVISTPLVLQVFDAEIRTEISKIRQEESEAFQREQSQGSIGARIEELEGLETRLLATIRSGGTVLNVEDDPEVKALRERLEPFEKERSEYEDKATCELTGDRCEGGSRKSGPGPRYDNYRKKAQRAAQEIRDIKQQIDTKIEALQETSRQNSGQVLNEAKEKLTGVQGELGRLKTQQSDQQSMFEENNAANTGLLVRLEALGQASGGNSTLLWARIMLFLLITTLECLPIFVKVLSLVGRPSAYDRLLKVYEEQSVQTGKQTLRTRRATTFIQNSDELSYANHLRDERERTTRAMAQATAQAEYEIAQRALRLWREHRLREIEEDPGRFAQPGSPLPPPGPSPEALPPSRPPLQAERASREERPEEGFAHDPYFLAEPTRRRRRRSRWWQLRPFWRRT
ncbi:DUF4407 domain-containing protein [Actinocorallia populi]|uniref:DUF4407 domain-containing protein n=1 Tax=Actinocorallia populi TaxID=2079200 RepID=UPI001300B40A|nr:DUF4407 domain-containing protein [Actinocorallia populi]